MNESRHRIIDCACEMFLADGLDSFSMRKLAGQLGVTAPAIYRHFASKEKVLRGVRDEAFKVFASYLYRALEGTTPQERLRLTGEAYVSFALDHPRFYQIIHLTPDVLGFADPPEIAIQAQATRQFLADRVRDCMQHNVLASDDPDTVAAAIWAFSHGVVSLYLGGVLPVEKEELPRLFFTLAARMFRGIGGPGFAVNPEYAQSIPTAANAASTSPTQTVTSS